MPRLFKDFDTWNYVWKHASAHYVLKNLILKQKLTKVSVLNKVLGIKTGSKILKDDVLGHTWEEYIQLTSKLLMRSYLKDYKCRTKNKK
jgi:hypothetical protein